MKRQGSQLDIIAQQCDHLNRERVSITASMTQTVIMKDLGSMTSTVILKDLGWW